MEEAWKNVCGVSGGTLHLRNRGSKYLPIEPAENRTQDYPIRLSRAIFFNAFERTLHGLVGMVFRKEPKFSKDVPEIIRGREAAEINQAEELEMLRGLVFAVLGVENASDDQVQFLARITGIAERY